MQPLGARERTDSLSSHSVIRSSAWLASLQDSRGRSRGVPARVPLPYVTSTSAIDWLVLHTTSTSLDRDRLQGANQESSNPVFPHARRIAHGYLGVVGH
jgi:hypothetical protein